MEPECRITAATSRDLHSTLSIFNDNVHADDKDGMYLLHKDDYDAVAGPDDDMVQQLLVKMMMMCHHCVDGIYECNHSYSVCPTSNFLVYAQQEGQQMFTTKPSFAPNPF